MTKTDTIEIFFDKQTFAKRRESDNKRSLVDRLTKIASLHRLEKQSGCRPVEGAVLAGALVKNEASLQL